MTAISTRKALTIHLDSGPLHFVRDNVGFTVDGVSYNAAPYGDLHGYTSKSGVVSDRLKITLDGSIILSGPDGTDTSDNIFQSLFNEKLRKKRVDAHRLDISLDTGLAVSRKHKYAGRIDKAYLDRKDPKNPKFIIECLSYRLLAQTPPVRLYSDVEQRAMYPDDGCFKHVADVVFRDGKFTWNQEDAGSGNSGGGGSGGGSDDRINRTIRRFLN